MISVYNICCFEREREIKVIKLCVFNWIFGFIPEQPSAKGYEIVVIGAFFAKNSFAHQ